MQIIVRSPPKSFSQCITSQAVKPDAAKALTQWKNYVSILESIAGQENVMKLPAIETHPDCLFVEDPVVCIRTPNGEGKACINSLGHEARRGEEKALRSALLKLGVRCLEMSVEKDARLDGGDVLNTGKHLFVGLSERTNMAGFEFLKGALEKDLECVALQVPGGVLHLKSLVTKLRGTELLLADIKEGIELWRLIESLGGEYTALFVPNMVSANVLSFEEQKIVLMQDVCKKSVDGVTKHLGEEWNVRTIDMSETIKADGALTCMSVIF